MKFSIISIWNVSIGVSWVFLFYCRLREHKFKVSTTGTPTLYGFDLNHNIVMIIIWLTRTSTIYFVGCSTRQVSSPLKRMRVIVWDWIKYIPTQYTQLSKKNIITFEQARILFRCLTKDDGAYFQFSISHLLGCWWTHSIYSVLRAHYDLAGNAGTHGNLEHNISTEDGTNNYRSSTRNQPVGERSLFMQVKSDCLDGTLLWMQRVGCGLYPSAGRTRMFNVEYYGGSRYEIDSRHDIVESSDVSYK